MLSALSSRLLLPSRADQVEECEGKYLLSFIEQAP